MNFLKSKLALESIEEETSSENETQEVTNNEDTQVDTETNQNQDTGDTSVDDNADNAESTNDDSGVDSAISEGEVSEAEGDQEQIQEEQDSVADDVEAVEVELEAENHVAQECYQLCDELNTVTGVTVSLESIHEYINASVKNGSYTHVDAANVRSQLNRELSHLNLKTNAIPSLEADATPEQQSGNAFFSMSNIKAMYERFIKKAMEICTNVYEYVSKRFELIFSATARLKRTIDPLYEYTKKQDTVAHDVNSTRMYAGISYAGSTDKLDEKIKVATQVITYFTDEKTMEPLINIAESVESDDATAIKKVEKGLRDIKNKWSSKLQKTEFIKEDGWRSSDLMPGNYVFATYVPETMDSMASLGSKFERIAAPELTGDAIVPAMSLDKYREILNNIKTGIAAIEKSKNSDVAKKFKDVFSSLAKSAKNKVSVENQSILRTIFNSVISAVTASAKAPHVVFSSGYLTLAKNYVQYIIMSTRYGYVNQAVDYLDEKTKPARDYVGDKASQVGNYVDEKTKPARDYVGDKASAARNYVGDKASAARNYVGDKTSGLKDRFSRS